MSEDYKKKYLEYKLKYIQLKQTIQNANQTGGTRNRIIEICNKFKRDRPVGFTPNLEQQCNDFISGSIAASAEYEIGLLNQLQAISSNAPPAQRQSTPPAQRRQPTPPPQTQPKFSTIPPVETAIESAKRRYGDVFELAQKNYNEENYVSDETKWERGGLIRDRLAIQDTPMNWDEQQLVSSVPNAIDNAKSAAKLASTLTKDYILQNNSAARTIIQNARNSITDITALSDRLFALISELKIRGLHKHARAVGIAAIRVVLVIDELKADVIKGESLMR
jgi:hypothetical protein